MKKEAVRKGRLFFVYSWFLYVSGIPVFFKLSV